MKKRDTEEKSQKMIELTVERKKRSRQGAKGAGNLPLDDSTNGLDTDASHMPETGNEAEDTPESSATAKKRTVGRVTLGSLLLIIFTIFYVPSLLNWLSGANAAQDVIRNGIIEEYIPSEAVIIRQEELLEPSPIDGRYIAEINEGEKTAAYSRISLVTGKESDDLLEDIERINEKIVKARMEQIEKSDFFSSDLASLDAEIGLKVQELIAACNAKSFEEMCRQRSAIRKIVEKKAEIVAGNSTDEYIRSLQREKEMIQEKINKNTKQIRTNISGIVSYKIDGYESVLTPNSIEDLTCDKLDDIIKASTAFSAQTGKVQAGLPFVKIIKGTDLYLAAAIPSDKSGLFEEDKSIRLRINNSYLETSGIITRVSEGENDRTLVTVRISRGVDTLSDKRVVNVDFITKTEEGLKVPLKCLRDISSDGKTARIMLVRYNVAVNRYVDIVCSDEEYAIIKTPEDEYEKRVDLYNIYLINPDHIEEGDIVGK